MQSKSDKKEKVDYWIHKIKQPLGSVSDEDRLVIDFLRITIDDCIEEWAKEYGFDRREISRLLNEKAEVLGHFLLDIYRLYRFIFWRVGKFFSEERLNSWLKTDYENAENIRAQRIPLIIEKDENGAVKDVSIDTSKGQPGVYGSAKGHPEDLFLNSEFYSKIMTLLRAIGSSRRRHAAKHRRILEMELIEEIFVGQGHESILGAGKKKIASLKHDAYKSLRDSVWQKCPELTEEIQNLKMGTNHEIHKSTKAERQRYRFESDDDEVAKPGPIRMWTEASGWKTITYEEALLLQKANGRRKMAARSINQPGGEGK